MTRMTGPDCVVMCNLINKYIHTYIHIYIHTYIHTYIQLLFCHARIVYTRETKLSGANVARLIHTLLIGDDHTYIHKNFK